jgi:small subunit ribosomal protein S16
MIVQDSRFHPSSGRVVAYLGNYNPHTKESNFDKEKLGSYLKNGAQPSPRVIKLLKAEKVKLPEWVKEPASKKKDVRNPDKRRSTRPEGVPAPEPKASVEETADKEKPKETNEEPKAETEKTDATTQAEAEVKPPDEQASTEDAKTQPEAASEPEKPAEK